MDRNCAPWSSLVGWMVEWLVKVVEWSVGRSVGQQVQYEGPTITDSVLPHPLNIMHVLALSNGQCSEHQSSHYKTVMLN